MEQQRAPEPQQASSTHFLSQALPPIFSLTLTLDIQETSS